MLLVFVLPGWAFGQQTTDSIQLTTAQLQALSGEYTSAEEASVAGSVERPANVVQDHTMRAGRLPHPKADISLGGRQYSGASEPVSNFVTLRNQIRLKPCPDTKHEFFCSV
jgi:hypothetical protein